MAANGAVTSRTWYQGQDLMANRRGVQTYIAQYAASPSGPWTECYGRQGLELHRHRPDQRHGILVRGARHRRRRPQRLERPRLQTGDLSAAWSCGKPGGAGLCLARPQPSGHSERGCQREREPLLAS
jgi:hypothetical protein